ncbi:MAG: hypothetical protein ACI4BC_08020, partial [Muribaculaceae bacterium]
RASASNPECHSHITSVRASAATTSIMKRASASNPECSECPEVSDDTYTRGGAKKVGPPHGSPTPLIVF